MRYLGIDYGTKRVGVAVSDDSGTIARPLVTLAAGPKLLPELEKIIAAEKPGAIVVGISDGNPVQAEIGDFIAELTLRTMLPIETMTEAFTSYEAHGRQGKESKAARATKMPAKPANLDARAAAFILERYLEKHRGHHH